MKYRELVILVSPGELQVTVTDESGEQVGRLEAHDEAVAQAEPALIGLVTESYREAIA